MQSVAMAPQDIATQVAMVQRSAREDQMPPLLRRHEPETYRVLEGEVVFFVGNDMVWARSGDVVVAPAGEARTFRVVSAEARWLVHTQVYSLARFHDFGRAVSRPLASPDDGWPAPEEQAVVEAMAAANCIELLGPPGALPS